MKFNMSLCLKSLCYFSFCWFRRQLEGMPPHTHFISVYIYNRNNERICSHVKYDTLLKQNLKFVTILQQNILTLFTLLLLYIHCEQEGHICQEMYVKTGGKLCRVCSLQHLRRFQASNSGFQSCMASSILVEPFCWPYKKTLNT